ncbi:MAG: 16S rRNA (guanine(966)-N(2))-methyltransferase RsmD [Gammaproteobacteria bacterium]|nr:16S rRNA (guanine(966)-N(2))-methyltransferase RsmD [Gammaproteobacteria bacterium]
MSTKGRNHVRIIGGKWKNTRINLSGSGLVRPTPVRAREVLFNWLNFRIASWRVLDVFAGSGCLSFEALSRGAKTATLLDNNHSVCTKLRRSCSDLQLSSDQATVIKTDAYRWLENQDSSWDLIFLDPPFRQVDWYPKYLRVLKDRVSNEGFIYVESSKREEINLDGFRVFRMKDVGEVRIALVTPHQPIACRKH